MDSRNVKWNWSRAAVICHRLYSAEESAFSRHMLVEDFYKIIFYIRTNQPFYEKAHCIDEISI